MSDLPRAMLQEGRPEDPHFKDAEYLYRRFNPDGWDGNLIEVDALELPDLSVNRQKYGPPEWLLLQEGCEDWGVLGFQVQDIPKELLHLGVLLYTFRPVHVPLKYNYPHSEVRAYENGVHINAKDRLDPELHLRWRERLQRKTRVIIRPS